MSMTDNNNQYPLYHYDIQQNTPEWENTPEWDEIRLGKMTASAAMLFLVQGETQLQIGATVKVGDKNIPLSTGPTQVGEHTLNLKGGLIIANPQNNPSHPFGGTTVNIGVGFQHYIYRKAGEWIQGASDIGGFQGNEITKYGRTYEPLAVEAYEEHNWTKTKKVGFVEKNAYVGCSPDRLVGNDGGLEIKCFQSTNFLRCKDGVYPHKKEIDAQVQFNLYVTGRKWWDLFIFQPNPAFENKAFVQTRHFPDKRIFRLFEKAELAFVHEINRITKDYLTT